MTSINLKGGEKRKRRRGMTEGQLVPSLEILFKKTKKEEDAENKYLENVIVDYKGEEKSLNTSSTYC